MIETIVLAILFWTDLSFREVDSSSTDTRITANLPINPVETGAVFALRCQVWNLGDGDSVQVFKTAKGGRSSLQLSIDDSVKPGVDERVFMAVRHLGDGSVIYFLSIIDATIDDEAEYSCKVVSTYPKIAEIAVETVDLQVMYFPSVSSPTCDAIRTDFIYEGDMIRLACHSETGNPTVSVRWKRTGVDKYLNAEVNTADGQSHSVATITARVRDNGAVFLCEISSKGFPSKTHSCHVGPVTIVKHPSRPFIPEITTVASFRPKDSKDLTIGGHVEIPLTYEDCTDVCGELEESQVIYWVVGTIIAAVLALLFCIVCLVLLLKFCKTTTDRFTEDYVQPIEDADKIYVEVESKRDSGKMYMSLVKPFPESHLLQQVPQTCQKM